MAISPVQNAHAASSTASELTVALGSSANAGDLLIASVCLPTGASVASIVDGLNRRYMQVAYAYGPSSGSEIWMCRGAAAGAVSASITFTSAVSAGVNLSEWSGVSLIPVDQWSQNNGASSTSIATTVTPRQLGDLFVGVVSAPSTSISSTPSGYTVLSQTETGYGGAYLVASGSVSSTPQWGLSASVGWTVATACFMEAQGQFSVPANVNPDLQFPETLVQISTNPNWQAPLNGQGVFTDITQYVQSMTLGPIGRQHELDRVQAAPSQISLDNRGGIFNPWNTTSFLYNSGHGLKPMNPVKVTAAWNGVTSPQYYGYFQSITNQIKDVLNVDAQLNCIDIFQILALKYLASDTYLQLVKSDGGANLAAYYQLDDLPGNYTVKDYSGNKFTGSLINGPEGIPAYNAAGPFLFDASTALDLTNGTNVLNGGFQTVDNTANPPTVHNPLGSASVWTLELWMKSTQQNTGAIGSSQTFLGHGTSGNSYINAEAGVPSNFAIGDAITGPGVPGNTVVLGFDGTPPNVSRVLISNALTSSPGNGSTFTLTIGGLGSTLITAGTTNGGNEIDVRVGAATTSGSVTFYNRVLIGTVAPSPVFNIIGYSNEDAVLDGNWHHIAVTYAASVSNIYVDGSLDSTWSTGSDWSEPTEMTVGCDAGFGQNPTNGFPGTLAQVALYSSVLTATQIANHYQTGHWFQSVETAVGSGASPRLLSVLDVAGVPLTALYCPYNFLTMLYGETNPVTTTSALNYIQTMTETEPGIIFQGPGGTINAYNRQYQYKNPTSTVSQGIFGDNTSTAQYHYEGPSFTTGQDDLDVFNDIQVQSGRGGFQLSAINTLAGSSQTPVGAPFTVGGGQLQEWGPTQSSALATSASVYGSRTLQGLTSLQFEYDSDALAVAQNYAKWYGSPIFRVQQMTVNSFANGGANISQMLGRGIYDRITVQYQGQVPGPQFSQESLIEQISHTVTMTSGPTWATVFALSPYEILMHPTYLGVFRFG